MTVIIKYKACMTWTDKKGFHEDIYCNVLHEVRYESDGTYTTVKLEWESYPGEPK